MKRLQYGWAEAFIPVCAGTCPGRPQEQFGETLACPATAWQGAEWPVLYGCGVLEGLPNAFCEVIGMLSPWFN